MDVRACGFALVEVRAAEATGHAAAKFRDDSSGGAAEVASLSDYGLAAPLPGTSSQPVNLRPRHYE